MLEHSYHLLLYSAFKTLNFIDASARNNKQDSVIRNRRDSTRGTVKSTSKSPNPHRNQSHHERHPDKSEKGETERDSEEVHLELIEDRVENLEQKVSSCPDRDERSDRGLSRV